MSAELTEARVREIFREELAAADRYRPWGSAPRDQGMVFVPATTPPSQPFPLLDALAEPPASESGEAGPDQPQDSGAA